MSTMLADALNLFHKPNEFIACIEYTASQTGFRSELIEKDFLCSLVLMHIYGQESSSLVFKGGTSLAKIHAGFYRLSEDLDFSLSICHTASRRQRSQMVEPFKALVSSIPKHIELFNIDEPLEGANGSRQYNARLSYPSRVSPKRGQILFEIAVREEHLQKSILINANTALLDFLTEKSSIPPFQINSFSKQEAYSEKMRAWMGMQDPIYYDHF